MGDTGINIIALCGGFALLAAIYMAGGWASLLGAIGVTALLYSFVASRNKRKEK